MSEDHETDIYNTAQKITAIYLQKQLHESKFNTQQFGNPNIMFLSFCNIKHFL